MTTPDDDRDELLSIRPKFQAMFDSSTWARDFTVEDMERLEKYFHLRRFPTGSLIFAEGDHEDYMAVIMDGTIEISKHDASPEHASKRLVVLGPGRAFGELALIEGCPRSASARARTNVTLMVLTRQDFDDLCRHNKALALKLAINIARLMSFRLRNTSEKLVEFL